MPFDERLAERVRRSFARRRVVAVEKRMMGGLVFMVHDKMCVGVEKDRLMVRLDPATYDDAIAQPGCVPMNFTGRPMRGFVFVHPEGLGGAQKLTAWIERALNYNPHATRSAKRSSRTAPG